MHIINSNIYLPATLIGTLKHLLIHTIVKLANHVTALQYMKIMQIHAVSGGSVCRNALLIRKENGQLTRR